jgi:hypothetical protein
MDTEPLREWADLGREGPTYVAVRRHPPVLRVGKIPIVIWPPIVAPKETPSGLPAERMFVGVHALLWTVLLGCDPIYVAGFDFTSDNVYQGTRGYVTTPTRPQEEQERKLVEGLNVLKHWFLTERDCEMRVPRFRQLPPGGFQMMEYVEVPERWLRKSGTTP